MERIALCRSSTFSLGVPLASMYPPIPFTFWSPPEQKAFVAGPCQYDNAYVGPFAAYAHGIEHFEICLRSERVVYFWTVYGDFSHTVAVVKQNVFVVLYLSPVIHLQIDYYSM